VNVEPSPIWRPRERWIAMPSAFGGGLGAPWRSAPAGSPAPPIPAPPQISGLVGLYWHNYGITTDGGGNLVAWDPVYWDPAVSAAAPLVATGAPLPWSSGAAWNGGLAQLELTIPASSNAGGRTGWGMGHRTSRPIAGSIPFPSTQRPVAFSSYNFPGGATGGFGQIAWPVGVSRGEETHTENFPSGDSIVAPMNIGAYSQAGPSSELLGWDAPGATMYQSSRDPGVSDYNSSGSIGTILACDMLATGIFVVGSSDPSANMEAGTKTTVVALWVNSIALNMATIADYIESLP